MSAPKGRTSSLSSTTTASTPSILRNRLRKDGYNAQTDAVYDAHQAIRRGARACRGVGHRPAEDRHHGLLRRRRAGRPRPRCCSRSSTRPTRRTGDPLAGESSRPDFVGMVYPGPDAVRARAEAADPAQRAAVVHRQRRLGRHAARDLGRRVFRARCSRPRVPNLEMHIYGNGVHANGLKDRSGTPFGTWHVAVHRLVPRSRVPRQAWRGDQGGEGHRRVRGRAAEDAVSAM